MNNVPFMFTGLPFNFSVVNGKLRATEIENPTTIIDKRRNKYY